MQLYGNQDEQFWLIFWSFHGVAVADGPCVEGSCSGQRLDAHNSSSSCGPAGICLPPNRLIAGQSCCLDCAQMTASWTDPLWPHPLFTSSTQYCSSTRSRIRVPAHPLRLTGTRTGPARAWRADRACGGHQITPQPGGGTTLSLRTLHAWRPALPAHVKAHSQPSPWLREPDFDDLFPKCPGFSEVITPRQLTLPRPVP